MQFCICSKDLCGMYTELEAHFEKKSIEQSCGLYSFFIISSSNHKSFIWNEKRRIIILLTYATNQHFLMNLHVCT